MKVNNHLVSIVTIVKNDFNSLERTILSIPISTSIESIISKTSQMNKIKHPLLMIQKMLSDECNSNDALKNKKPQNKSK